MKHCNSRLVKSQGHQPEAEFSHVFNISAVQKLHESLSSLPSSQSAIQSQQNSSWIQDMPPDLHVKNPDGHLCRIMGIFYIDIMV